MQHIDSQDDSCFKNGLKNPQNALFSLPLVFALRRHCKIDPWLSGKKRQNTVENAGLLDREAR